MNKLRSFDHFYHAPITNERSRSNVSYERQLDYEIIQAEDVNKYELLEKEKENDKLIHNQELLVHIENLFKNFVCFGI